MRIRSNRWTTGNRPGRLAAVCAVLLCAGCAAPAPDLKPSEQAPEPTAAVVDELFADANLLAQNGRYDEASLKLESLLDREDDHLPALRLLASVYAAMGEKGKATDIWRRVSLLDPTDADAAYETGISAARRGDWTAVRRQMTAIEAVKTADRRHHLLLGEANLELGYKRDAERYLLMASGLERADYLLGKLYWDQGKLAEAQRRFEAVLERNASNAGAHLHLGWLHYRSGNKRTALDHYERSVEANPDDPLAQLSLAALLEENKRPEAAIVHYTRALVLSGIPRSEKKKAYNSATRLLVEVNRLGEAEDLVRRGLREYPNSGGLYYQWGEILQRRGDSEGAKEKFKNAAADPTWREIALKRLHSIR